MSTDAPRPKADAGGGRPARQRQPRTGWRRIVPTWRGTLRALLGGIVVLLGLFLAGYLLTPVPAANSFATSEASIVYWDDGTTVLGRYAAENRQSVDLSQVPEHVQHAVVAAEDRSFYDNRGISPSGIARAAWSNLRGDDLAGGSTITQQYVKNYYLSQERTFSRKIRELFISLKIDRELSKGQILADYLNTVYFGRGAYGVQTAAQAYFHKPVDRLTVAEGAVLAAVLRAPALYDPAVDPANRERLEQRWHYVIDGMVEKGWLGADEAATLKFPKIHPPRSSNRLAGPRGFLVESVVRKELVRLGFDDAEIETGGLRVTTTFDRTSQAALEQAVTEERPTQNAAGVHIGAASVRPGTGALVALYGGPDYVKDQRNWATTGRQPGSSFKPYALAGALSDGYSLHSRFAGNSPYVLDDGTEVQNEFGNSYGSSVDLVEATAESINTAYVDLTVQMGPQKVVDAAVAAGVPANAPGLEANVTNTLGTADVSPADMATAYATFAAQGVRAPRFSVLRVRDRSGHVLYDHRKATERAFDADVTSDVTYALEQVVKSGTGTAALGLGRPAAGKTGTAALRPDTVTSAWFVGYTPQLSTAVMYVRGKAGTADLDGVGGLSTFFGGAYPARTWTAAMKGELEGQDVLDLPEPAFVGEDLTPPSLIPQPAPTAQAPTSSPTPTPTASPTPTATRSPTRAPTPSPTRPSNGGTPPATLPAQRAQSASP